MGNLYTHLVSHHNSRLTVLQQLKFQYRNKPRDYRVINELQEKLRIIEGVTKPQKQVSLSKKYGMFAWKVKEEELMRSRQHSG